MSGNSLPPLQRLPHWTRVGYLVKPGLPRRLPVNQQPQTPAVPPTVGAAEKSEDPRVASLRRNVQFLQRQHEETLEKLHAEIDYLRRENKGVVSNEFTNTD